jgi:hypothetical protein
MLAVHDRVRRALCDETCSQIITADSWQLRDDAAGLGVWRWSDDDSKLEWRCLFDVSGAIYRYETALEVISGARALLGVDSISHPNNLEVACSRIIQRALTSVRCEYVAAPQATAAVVVTVNRVQSVCTNAVYDVPQTSTTAFEMLYRNGGAMFDEQRYASCVYNTPHVSDVWFKTAPI